MIQKIRAEIERRIEIQEYWVGKTLPGTELAFAVKEELKQLLDFLDTLEESEKPIPKDLEEAAEKYATEWHKNPDGSAWKPYFEVSAIKAFIARAKWDRSQMLKEAVEAKIYGYDDGSFELIASWLDMPNNSIYKDGDKVKIIIVKED